MSLFGGKLAAIGGAILAGLLIVWRILAQQKRAGIDQQKVKEGEAREDDLEKIKRAADAGAHIDPGSVSDDPYNRDRRRKP